MSGPESSIATKLVIQEMNGIAQTRISWHRLVTVVLALVVMGAPVSASFCAQSDCFAPSSMSETTCSKMTMPQNTSAILAGSHTDCCQVTPVLPATMRQSTVAEKAKAAFSPVPLPSDLSSVVAARRTLLHPLESSPPQDVQSLFCTLLI